MVMVGRENMAGVLDTSTLDALSEIGALKGDPHYVAGLVGGFLSDSGGSITEIEDLLKSGAGEPARRLIHRLKGTAAAFGAIEFVSTCCRLEQLAATPGTEEIDAPWFRASHARALGAIKNYVAARS